MGSLPSLALAPEQPADPPPPSRRGRRALSIRELPLAERPRERLKALGAQSLSSAELLAILLGAGTAQASALRMPDDWFTSRYTIFNYWPHHVEDDG